MNTTSSNNINQEMKYKGVRKRRWGKWVSEIRVPGTQERLWLGSYASPEAAAVAHDVAFYCLRRPSSSEGLNFPRLLPASVNTNMSPKSVQRTASDAGMAIDARIIVNREEVDHNNWVACNDSREEEGLNISVEDYL